jgi:hypothetical protein
VLRVAVLNGAWNPLDNSGNYEIDISAKKKEMKLGWRMREVSNGTWKS